MRSFWDEVREMNVDFGVVFSMYVHPSKRPGVFVFRLVAVPTDSSGNTEMGTCTLQFEHPAVQMQSLPAALWMYSRHLYELCGKAHQDAATRKTNGR
jgi:hypothetical protein